MCGHDEFVTVHVCVYVYEDRLIWINYLLDTPTIYVGDNIEGIPATFQEEGLMETPSFFLSTVYIPPCTDHLEQ
jgi:hypothetical protein